MTTTTTMWERVERRDPDAVMTLRRTFTFADWTEALAFVNKVGAIADAQDHHPLVELTWGRVTLHVWSHDAKGLTKRDDVFCAAVDAL